MIGTWMIYVAAVSLLMGLAALAAEHSARLRRTRTRWYWLAAILASLLAPAIISTVAIRLPHLVQARAGDDLLVLRDTTRIALPLGTGRSPIQPQASTWRTIDPWISGGWLAASALMLGMLVINGVQLYRRRRTWKRATLLDTEVHVAPDIGPAVVGFLSPGIVVPAWLTQSALSEQAAVIAHERSHMKACDPQLFTIALCLLVLMPWNLPLWWQLRRLRHAIEVDCDARVLADGHDVIAYSEVLIAVGERQSAFIGAVAAMSESRSHLEQRISMMNSKPARLSRVWAAAAGCLSLALVAVAAQVSPPNTHSAVDTITLRPTVLDLYAGYFKLGDSPAIAVVTRSGGQLFVKITGDDNQEVLATSPTHFVLKSDPSRAWVDFITDGLSPATAMAMHWGDDLIWQRMDPASGRQFEADLAERTQHSIATPGSEIALRGVLAWEVSGNPDYGTLSPVLSDSVRRHIKEAQALRASLGPVQFVQFQGVGTNGYDSYLVRFQKGTRVYRILLDDKGRIDRLLSEPL